MSYKSFFCILMFFLWLYVLKNFFHVVELPIFYYDWSFYLLFKYLSKTIYVCVYICVLHIYIYAYMCIYILQCFHLTRLWYCLFHLSLYSVFWCTVKGILCRWVEKLRLWGSILFFINGVWDIAPGHFLLDLLQWKSEATCFVANGQQGVLMAQV